MKDIALWVIWAIPASGIVSTLILLRDEMRARQHHQRVPR
jgi:hypothetical protein